ncbi:MAG: DUF3575 domain-containing protein [Cytophagales bacterium]
MNKPTMQYIAIVLFSIIFLSTNAQEVLGGKYQDKKGRPIRFNIIKTNLFGWPLGMYNVTYERKLTKTYSALLGVTIYGTPAISPITLDVLGNKAQTSVSSSGFAISPEFRWYVGKHGAPRGYYFGIYIPIINYNGTVDQNTTLFTLQQGNSIPFEANGNFSPNFTFYGVGLSGGPQFIIANRVSVELFLNIAIGIYSLNSLNYGLKGDNSSQITTILPNGNYTANQLRLAGIVVEDTPEYTYQISTNSNGSKSLVTNYDKVETLESRSGILPLPRIGFTVGYAFGK